MKEIVKVYSFVDLQIPTNQSQTDSYFIDIALKAAEEAVENQETPIGAVLVDFNHQKVFVSANYIERFYDGSAHAEMNVLRAASKFRKSRYLSDCTLFVTLEPCTMCAAAIGHFRISRLVYAAYDPKGGGVAHGPRLFDQEYTLHKPKECIGGIQESKAASMLKEFFKKLRS